MPTGLAEPTQNPQQPVTAGADAGAGPSMQDAGIAPAVGDAELVSKLGPLLGVFMRMADSQYSTDAFRQQVRDLRARIQR
jgi:type VI protein secretion system component VasF